MLVRQVRWEADGVVTLTLVDPEGAPLPGWSPGAHIDLVLPSGLRRQYSLCGDELDAHSYTVAVRLEDPGRGGSREVHGSVLVGRHVAIFGPHNRFPLAEAEHHLLLAGGIGVTPILSMARALQRRGSEWSAVYCGRTTRTMAFSRELVALDPARVECVTTAEEGRTDLAARIADLPAGAAVYCCGPAEMLEAVTVACLARGLAVHTERFGADPVAAAVGEEPGGDGPLEVELRRTGRTITVEPDQTILEAVRDHIDEVDSSCEEGFCGTCESRVLEGVPDHRDTVLGTAEREANKTMMICVSRAIGGRLVLDR